MPLLRRPTLRPPSQPESTGPSSGSLVQFTLSDPRQHDRERKEQQAPGHESAGTIVQKRNETGVVAGVGRTDDVRQPVPAGDLGAEGDLLELLVSRGERDVAVVPS